MDNIYSKFELLKYLTTDRKLIEIKNSEIFHKTFPHSLDLEFGEEILPRQVKFLKEYYETLFSKTRFPSYFQAGR